MAFIHLSLLYYCLFYIKAFLFLAGIVTACTASNYTGSL